MFQFFFLSYYWFKIFLLSSFINENQLRILKQFFFLVKNKNIEPNWFFLHICVQKYLLCKTISYQTSSKKKKMDYIWFIKLFKHVNEFANSICKHKQMYTYFYTRLNVKLIYLPYLVLYVYTIEINNRAYTSNNDTMIRT